jgi:hypothetical protein
MNQVEYRTKQMNTIIRIAGFVVLVLYILFSLKLLFLETSIMRTIIN